MSLASILAGLALDLPAIRASAPEAIKLAGLYRTALGTAGQPAQGIYSRFIRAAVRGGFTLAQARTVYQQAKFWGTYAQILADWPSTTPLPPQLAGEAKARQPFDVDYGRWRTHVSVTLRDPLTGESRRYGFYFSDTTAPTRASLEGRAELAVEGVIGESPTIGGRTTLGGLTLDYTIDEFVALY